MAGTTPKTFAKTDTLGSYSDNTLAVMRTLAGNFTADALGSYADSHAASRTPLAVSKVYQWIDDVNDDGREASDGSVNLTISPMVDVNAIDEWYAFRFKNITIPQGALIHSAILSLVCPDSNNDEPDHPFWGEASDNASALSTATNNISSRTKTTATVTWSSTNLGAIGRFNIPDVAAIIQEIVSRPGWVSGNAIVIFCHGSADPLRDLVCSAGSPGFESNAPQLTVYFDASLGVGLSDGLAAYNETLGYFKGYCAAFTDELGFGITGSSSTGDLFDNLPVSGAAVSGSIPGVAGSVVEHDSLNWLLGVAVSLSDNLGGYADSQQVLFGQLVRLADDLNNWVDSLSIFLTPFELTAVFTDALGSYADTLAGRLEYLVRQSDGLGGYADTYDAMLGELVRFTDDLNNWADEVVKILTGEQALVAALTDALNQWNDALAVVLTTGGAIQPGDEVQVIIVGGIECHVLIDGNTGATPVRVVIASPKQITVLIDGNTGASPIHVTI